MVKDVVHICADLNAYPIVYVEVFMYAQIYTPRSGPPEHVALCHLRVAEDVSSNGGRCERIRIPNPVAILLIEIVVDDPWPVRRLGIEVADRIERGDSR